LKIKLIWNGQWSLLEKNGYISNQCYKEFQTSTLNYHGMNNEQWSLLGKKKVIIQINVVVRNCFGRKLAEEKGLCHNKV
jgi:hypothetical protein